MSNEKQINDLVNMLDQFVLAGGGHMNVEVEDSSRLDEVQVETTNSNCCQKNMACQVPTLHEGIDGEE
ncbi:hypothetical protein [Anaeromicropila herbilytica]|uniref:Uncharacterized protein n=1 Tax=Anaeromicropila herbilytica TaxID=2785025 RepID=A0A7R7EPV0_9FIRM|nr:hypothetical protein [Anaeromicropila herbilytica]BCN32829.1 hypothetical protein bsdtb5_41240 [Anaeromicropila herbilytica]